MIYAVIKSGATLTEDENLTIQKLNALGVPTVEINGTVETADVAAEAITNAKLALEQGGNEGAIKDNVIAGDAAIKLVKLEGLPSLQLVAGDSAGAAAAHTVGGDLTLSRCVKIEAQDPAIGSIDINVGDEIRFATDSGRVVGDVVSVVANGGNKDVYYNETSKTGTLKTSVEDILVMPSSIVVIHKHNSATPPTEQISIGDKLSTGDGSAIVSSVSTYPGSGVLNGGVYDYEVTVGLVAVSGHFLGDPNPDSPNIDRTLAVGDSLHIKDTSGAVAKGRTVLDGGNNTEYDANTAVLAATVKDLDTESNLVKTTRLVAESAASAGQVLTVDPDGVGVSAQNLPANDGPICRGEIECVPAEFLEGNDNISVWDIKGGFYYGTTTRTLLVLHNSNRTSTPESRWSVGDELVVANKNASGDMSPVNLSTPLSVYTVTNVYNYQTVNGSGTTDMVALELKDSTDTPVNVLNTGSPTTGGTTYGYIGRRVTDVGGLLSGAKLFKSVWGDQKLSVYALVFDAPAADDEFSIHIHGEGLWTYGNVDGAYPQWRDAPSSEDDAAGYTNYHPLVFHRGSTKTTAGFTFMMLYKSRFNHDTRAMSILVYP